MVRSIAVRIAAESAAMQTTKQVSTRRPISGEILHPLIDLAAVVCPIDLFSDCPDSPRAIALKFTNATWTQKFRCFPAVEEPLWILQPPDARRPVSYLLQNGTRYIVEFSQKVIIAMFTIGVEKNSKFAVRAAIRDTPGTNILFKQFTVELVLKLAFVPEYGCNMRISSRLLANDANCLGRFDASSCNRVGEIFEPRQWHISFTRFTLTPSSDFLLEDFRESAPLPGSMLGCRMDFIPVQTAIRHNPSEPR